MADIAIVGAGITGITTAYELIQQGHKVTVYDRHRYPAMETSYANGGQLSASNAEVWNSWRTVAKGMKWLFKKDAPLLFNLSPSWHKYSWIAEFLAATRHYRENSMETVRIALMSRARMFEIAEQEDIEFHHEKRGILHFYKNGAALDQAGRVNHMLCEAGLDRHQVDVPEIEKLEPSLNTQKIVGGYYTPGDSTGDIHAFTRGLAKIFEERGGSLQLGAHINDCNSASGGVHIAWTNLENSLDQMSRHDGIVICAGVGSRNFARQLGDRVNVYPVKGYSITVPVPDDAPRDMAPWTSLLDESAKVVTSRLGQNRYRVAGTAEINGHDYDIRAGRVRPLVEWVEEHHPKLETSGSIPWAGLRPMMPDMMPRVCQGRSDRVFYNTGHGHLGWTMSAGTAQMVCALIDGRFDSETIAPNTRRQPETVAA